MGVNKFSDQRLDQMPLLGAYHKKWTPPPVPDRPHAKTSTRYECQCEEDMAIEGFDVNNYTWLDQQKKCILQDWKGQGKVGFPRDQLTCGSCWAQTTTSAIATNHAIKHHIFARDEVLELSPQQLLDCDLIPNMGCMGGEALYAYRYVRENGLALDEDYPYVNKLRTCVYDADTMHAVGISDFKVF